MSKTQYCSSFIVFVFSQYSVIYVLNSICSILWVFPCLWIAFSYLYEFIYFFLKILIAQILTVLQSVIGVFYPSQIIIYKLLFLFLKFFILCIIVVILIKSSYQKRVYWIWLKESWFHPFRNDIVDFKRRYIEHSSSLSSSLHAPQIRRALDDNICIIILY